MIAQWVLDHFHQLDTGLCRGDAVLVQQLDHQTTEPLECPGYPGGGVYFYQHVVCSSDVNLGKCENAVLQLRVPSELNS